MPNNEDAGAGFLGVLGGMGPMAGATFMQRLTALTDAEFDQQHVPAILWSDPRIPSRSKGYLKQGPDPFPWMLGAVKVLADIGAQTIVIPCNTAHLWYQPLAAASPVPILHIVQAVVADLRRQGVHQGRVGLMGTAATLKLGLYQQVLEAAGYQCLVPTEEELDAHCCNSIALVAANRPAEALAPATACVRSLKARGADVVVLGCTELPLAIPHLCRPELGVPVVDSIDALALAAIEWYRSSHPRE